MQNWDAAVIGGGAAGFFAAIRIRELNPGLKVCIIEKTGKLLSKVRISGGGRCNVTHHQSDHKKLCLGYPRGAREMRQWLKTWDVQDTVRWFETHGAPLKTEPDGRMFPVTDSSETICHALLGTAQQLNIEIITGCGLEKVLPEDHHIRLKLSDGKEISCAHVVLCCGGFQKTEQYAFLNATSHRVEEPVPSLFTFNIKDRELHRLMGLSAHQARVKVAGSDEWHSGPVLVTHWGLSGPGVLKTSAWEALRLAELNYRFRALVNWTGLSEKETTDWLNELIHRHGNKKLINCCPEQIPQRLWEYLILRAEAASESKMAELPRKQKNLLMEQLIRCDFSVEGKTTFKEEFVTAGGISLEEVNENLESRFHPGLYFAGELLNIDGITGGFNFQAAWTTAAIAAKAIAQKL